MYLVVVDPHSPLYDYLDAAHRKGLRTLVLAPDLAACRRQEANHNRHAGHRPQTQIDELVQCNVASSSAILAALEPYRGRIAGLLPGSETNVTETFEAGTALGFDCAGPEDARSQHVKTAMKSRLVEHGVPTPPFRAAGTLAEAEEAWHSFGRDCIVKMVDYRSSANVYRVRSSAELEQAWDAIMTNRMSLRVSFPLAKEAIVEEFVGGRELTAEGYEADGRIEFLNFCEKGTSERFVVVDHFVPAHLSPAEQAAVEEVARACVRALRIRNSVFHVEVHVLDGQPYVIECAARPPGSSGVLKMIRSSHGADLIDIAVDLSIGTPVTTRYREPSGHFAVLSVFTEKSGILTGLTGLAELRGNGGVRHWQLLVRLGDRVEALTDFRRQYGSLILEDKTAEGLRRAVEWTRENLRLLVTAEEPDGSAGAPAGSRSRDPSRPPPSASVAGGNPHTQRRAAMEQMSAAARVIHDTMIEQARHFHEQIHQLDAQIGELQMQRAAVMALARIELKRSPELKDAAGDEHNALVDSLFT